MGVDKQFSGYHDEVYRPYLERFANEHAAPRDMVEDIVAAELSSKASVESQIVQGEANVAYAIENGNEQYVLRVGQKDLSRFTNERWAIQEAEALGIAVPEIVAVGSREVREGSFSFSLQKRISGKLFDALLWVEKIDQGRAK